MLPSSPFVVRPRKRPEARFRLFLFHHAGGSVSIYRPWVEAMPATVELCLVSYPERLGLHRVPMPDCMVELVNQLQVQIEPLLDHPFALFGHSMGGQVVYQLGLNLLRSGARMPFWMGISGFEAPCQARRKTRERSLHRYDDDKLRHELLALGGTPDEVLRVDQAWQQFSILIRKDLRLFESWQHDPRSPTLPIPLTAFVGEADRLVGAQGCAYWEYFTSNWRGLHVLPGGHFYFMPDPQLLLSRVLDELDRRFDQAGLH